MASLADVPTYPCPEDISLMHIEASRQLGQAIKHLRRLHGRSREQLAQEMGFDPTHPTNRGGWSPRTITRIEVGQRGIDSRDLPRIARAIGVEPLEILHAAGQEPGPEVEREITEASVSGELLDLAQALAALAHPDARDALRQLTVLVDHIRQATVKER